MDMEQCQKIIAGLDSEQDTSVLYPGLSAASPMQAAEPSKAAAKAPADSSYLQAVVTGRATPPQKSIALAKREEKAAEPVAAVEEKKPAAAAMAHPAADTDGSRSSSGQASPVSSDVIMPVSAVVAIPHSTTLIAIPVAVTAKNGTAMSAGTKPAQSSSPALTRLMSKGWGDLSEEDCV